jgi:hypothetical protein
MGDAGTREHEGRRIATISGVRGYALGGAQTLISEVLM